MGTLEQKPDNLLANVLCYLRSSSLFNELLCSAQDEAQRTNIRFTDLKKGVQNGLVTAGWDRKLRNAIYHFLQAQPSTASSGVQGSPEQIKEPITYVRKAQLAWEKKILKSLNSMCTELTIPLARRRPEREQKDMMVRWTELGVDGPGSAFVGLIYGHTIKDPTFS